MIASIIFGNSYSHPKGWHLSCRFYVNFVEYEIISILSSNDDITDLEIENEELEDSVAKLENAFDSLKDNCCDRLKEIESDLEDIIENNELDSTIDKLKELKDDVEHQRWVIKDVDVDDF